MLFRSMPVRDPDAPCLDSSQAWFCRDLWVRSAQDAVKEVEKANNKSMRRRDVEEVAARDPLMEARDAVKVHVGSGEEEVNDDGADQRKIQGQKIDPDANAGSDYDAMPVEDGGEEVPPADPAGNRFSIPNSLRTDLSCGNKYQKSLPFQARHI